MSSPRSFRSDPADLFPHDQGSDDQLNGHVDDDRSQVEETQFGDLEVDTQATTGFDLEVPLPQPLQPSIPLKAIQDFGKSFSMPMDDEEKGSGFSFSRALIKTPSMNIAARGGAQAGGAVTQAVTAAEVQEAPITSSERVPQAAPQTTLDAIESVPRSSGRAALSNNDPNRQLSQTVLTRLADVESKMPYAPIALARPESRQNTSREPSIALKINEPLYPPFTQIPQAPVKKTRRKKTAPAAMQHEFQHQPLAPASDGHKNGEKINTPHGQRSTISQIDESEPSRPGQYFSGRPSPLGANHRDAAAVLRTMPIESQRGVNSSAAMAPGRVSPPDDAAHSSPERGMVQDSRNGHVARRAISRTTTQSRSGPALMPFPEVARGSSPKLAGRPLANAELQVRPVNGTGPTAGIAGVTKRKRSAVGNVKTSRTSGGDPTPEPRLQARASSVIQEEHPLHTGIMPREENPDYHGEQSEPLRPTRSMAPPLAARAPSGAGVSLLDLFDQAKNLLHSQTLEKDRELVHLKDEVSRLVLTVHGLEGTISKLEGDKSLLRGAMHKKCENLKDKVAELLKDHQAVGGFIEKTSTEIAKFNKYREKSGSVFKEAISKYANLQLHQKKTMEAIHETRLRVASDVADLTKAHSHESGIVVKDLQAEKKKVSELERIIEGEKQKVLNLQARLDAGLHDGIKAMLEKQNETFASKVDSHGKELLEAIDTKQEEKTASLKDYLQTLRTYKDHEAVASKSIGELLTMVTTLSANISEAMKSKDETLGGFQKVGAEIFSSIKEKVESISEAQTNQAELSNRVLLLETSKIDLQSQLSSERQAQSALQGQLEAKESQAQQLLEQLQRQEKELQALQSSLQQATTKSHQEIISLRSNLVTVGQEAKHLRESSGKLEEENQALQAQVSRLKGDGERALERLREAHEFNQDCARNLKTLGDQEAKALQRAEAGEAKISEIQAKLVEEATRSKQELEAQRTKMEEDKKRAVALGRQGTLSELSTLKKRYDILATEHTALKDAAAAQSTADLEKEIARLQLETAELETGHTTELAKYAKAYDYQTRELQVIKEQIHQVKQSTAQQEERMRQIELLKKLFQDSLDKMETRLVYYEEIELKIRCYCDEHNLNYDEMDAETFLLQVSANAVNEYRQTLSSSSLQYPRPSMSFSQSLTEAASAGSATQPSQSSATRNRAERNAETEELPSTPRLRRRSPSMPEVIGRSPVAAVSPPRARRNHSIAERRRILASSAKPPSPDIPGTPVRQPSDRTTGSGGRAGYRPAPSSSRGINFVGSQEASQKRTPGLANSHTAHTHAPSTPMHPPETVSSRMPDSDFSDLSDLVDMMDANPEVDVIPALEQRRRERASSTLEDSQSQRGKAASMDSPSTPRDSGSSQSREPKLLKSILKKRSHSNIASQEGDEAVTPAPPRKVLQPLKGKNSLASLGTGTVSFRSRQEAGPSNAVGSTAREQAPAGSQNNAVDESSGVQPASASSHRKMRRTKTIRHAAEPDAAPTPAAKKPRMSIPYNPSAKSGGGKKK